MNRFCAACGARLDPGESCDCGAQDIRKAAPARTSRLPSRTAVDRGVLPPADVEAAFAAIAKAAGE